MNVPNMLLPVAKAAAPLVTKVRANSPMILLVGGCACVVGGGILMARAGWKAREVEDVVEAQVAGVRIMPGSEAEVEERVQLIHREGVKEMAKQFILPGSLMVGGVAMICSGFHIQGARLVAAVAYASAVEESFSNYRANVIADQGPSADIRYMSGAKMEKADFYEEGEDGKLKKHKEDVLVMDRPSSPYAILFDDSNPNWVPDRAANLAFLSGKQERANMELSRKFDGLMDWNEVLEDCGFRKDPRGQMVGWEYKPDPEGSLCDGVVDFGLHEVYLSDELERAREERRNPEPSFWLDFNVSPLPMDRFGVPKF